MVKKILKAVFVIIGTLIGAGFASGQEIYIFFFKYGIYGMIGMVISSLILGMVIYRVFQICSDKKVKNYKEFLTIFVKSEKQLHIINTIINIFILITFFIMIAGFGSYFEQQFEIYHLIGSLLLAVICYFVFLKDVTGLIKVSQWIVPLLVGSLCVIGIFVIDIGTITNVTDYVLENTSWKWILDSILYGSYNAILLIPVLIALKDIVVTRQQRKMVTWITTGIICMLSFILFFILIRVDVPIENLEMPAVYVVSKISAFFKYLYGFIILSSILTTSVSLGTSFLENVVKNKKQYGKYAMLICVSSVIVSNIGFSNLVNLLYPIFGYIGLIQIIAMVKN